MIKRRMTGRKRFLAGMLSLCMMLTMMPVQARAEAAAVSEKEAQSQAMGSGSAAQANGSVDTAINGHYDANGFCKGYEIDPDGSGAWVKKTGDEACTDDSCNGYQPMTTVTEDGTEWYEISNAGQLYWFADQADNGNLLDANVRLTADIVDNEGVTFGWDENNDYAVVATRDGQTVDAKTLRMWNPIGEKQNGTNHFFAGHFDGQGHMVSGLYYDYDTRDENFYAGIFSRVLGTSENYTIVERVGLENSYLHSGRGAGGIAGFAGWATIRQCYNAAYLVSELYSGGIAGATNDSIILNEVFNFGEMIIVGDNNSQSARGQIVGRIVDLKKSNDAVHHGYVRSDLNIECVGILPSRICMNGIFLPKESFCNGEVAYLLNQSSATWGQNLSSENSLPNSCASDKYPVYKTCTGYTNDASEVHHSIVNGFCTNDGCDYYEEPHYNEAGEVYEISNAGQLYAYADKAQTIYTKGARLMADIVVNEEALIQEDGTPITDTADIRKWKGLFRAHGSKMYWNQKLTFDGNHHSISGLYAKGSGMQGFVLFDFGTVENLQINNSVFISTNDTAGGIVAGYLRESTADYRIENCSFEGYVEGAEYAGGIAGMNLNTSNCYADAYVKGGKAVNPIVADSDSGGSITNTAYNTDKYTAECTTTGVQGFTTDQFASGEVAYALNQGSSDATTDTWKQTLDGETKDSTPTLNTAKENVYQYERLRCDGTVKTNDDDKYAYTNASSKSGKSIPDEHEYEIDSSDHTQHKCKVCGGVVAHDYTYQVADGTTDTIQADCDVCHDSYTVKLTAPAGADGNLTYTGTGLAASTEITDGVLGETLPKIEYATVTDGAVSAYSTDVPVNAGSYRARLTLGTGENTASVTITYTIEPAVPFIIEKPEAAAITYGQTLADSTLTGGKAAYKDAEGAEITGTFAWKDGSIKPAVSDSERTEYDVIFTPDDATKYGAVAISVTLVVDKAAAAPDMPDTLIQAAHSAGTVGAVVLPDGWSWQDADKDIVLPVNTPVAAMAVYTGADKGNYETESIRIMITRKECDQKHTVVKGQLSATCTADGYSGDTYCADCGALIKSGTVIKASGHTYGTPQYTWKKDAAGKLTCTAAMTCTRTGCSAAEAGHTISETARATDKVTKAPTYTAKGKRTWTAVFVTAGFVAQTKTETIAVLIRKPKPVGTKLKDSKGATYKVTSAKSKSPTVQYTAPKKTAKGTITIPATVTIGKVTYKVTSVADNAFKKNKKITRVVIGNNIKSIGKNAFANCTKLTSITIGRNVSKIGKNAFSGCKKLTTITIKSTKLTTKTVAKGAFNGISKKVVVKVPKSKYKAYKKLLPAKGLNKKTTVKK